MLHHFEVSWEQEGNCSKQFDDSFGEQVALHVLVQGVRMEAWLVELTRPKESRYPRNLIMNPQCFLD